MEDVVLMVGPVFFRQLYGDLLQLVQKVVRAGDLKAVLQRRRHRVLVFLPVLPEVRIQRLFILPVCVGNVEYIAQGGLAPAVVKERDAPGATPDVAAHPLIPEVPLRAGGGFGPLGIDHQLLREGIFLKILSRGNVRLNFYLFSFLYSFKGNRRHSYREAAVITSIILALPPGHSSVL